MRTLALAALLTGFAPAAEASEQGWELYSKGRIISGATGGAGLALGVAFSGVSLAISTDRQPSRGIGFRITGGLFYGGGAAGLAYGVLHSQRGLSLDGGAVNPLPAYIAMGLGGLALLTSPVNGHLLVGTAGYAVALFGYVQNARTFGTLEVAATERDPAPIQWAVLPAMLDAETRGLQVVARF